MKKRRTSYAFLMEMMWVCGFFAMAACIFVLAFVKADHLSRSAENLNRAVLAAENAVEETFSGIGNRETGSDNGTTEDRSGGEKEIFLYDRSWNPLPGESGDGSAGAAFSVTVSSHEENGLLLVTAEVTDSSGSSLYALSGARSLTAERRMP